MTEAGHLFNLALGTAKIQQTSYKLLEPVARSWTKIQPCHLCINVLWIHPTFKMQVTGIKRSSRGIAVPVSSSAYCFVIKGLCAQTTWVQRAREAKPRKHRFRLSIINGKVWPSLTHLEGAEERLVTEFDTALMKRVTFLNAQRVLVEPASAALVCTGPLVPRHAAGWDLRRWGILWTGSPCLASPMVPSPNRRALAFGRELTGLPWAASFQTVLFWSFKVNDGWASRVDFEGSEKCNRVASISHLIFLTQEGKMKNMRHLPLNLQDFCLMWFIISISDVSGIKTWKHGPRRRVLDWPWWEGARQLVQLLSHDGKVGRFIWNGRVGWPLVQLRQVTSFPKGRTCVQMLFFFPFVKLRETPTNYFNNFRSFYCVLVDLRSIKWHIRTSLTWPECLFAISVQSDVTSCNAWLKVWGGTESLSKKIFFFHLTVQCHWDGG